MLRGLWIGLVVGVGLGWLLAGWIPVDATVGDDAAVESERAGPMVSTPTLRGSPVGPVAPAKPRDARTATHSKKGPGRCDRGPSSGLGLYQLSN